MDERPPLNDTGATAWTEGGPVRPGQRSAYHRPTKDQIEARVIFARGLLAKRAYKSEVRALLKRRFNVSFQTADAYIRRARALLAEESGISVQQARTDAIALYQQLIREKGDDPRLQVLCQDRLCALWGTDAAPKGAVNPDGSAAGGITQTLVQAALADPKGRELLAQLAEHVGGLGPQPPECGTPPPTRSRAAASAARVQNAENVCPGAPAGG
jgi:hypothetical protein